MIATATHSTFAGACLLESIDRPQHIQFIERRIAGERLVDALRRPTHIVGDVACRQFEQAFPSPPPSYPAEEQEWIDVSLRKWAKRTETHSTDQNHLCEYRYNRHIFCSGKIPPASETAAVWQMDIPRVPDVLPPPTLLELIQRENRLIREQRKSRWLLAQIIDGYESDWRTLAERDDLLRATKKARRSPHGLPPRSIVKDIDGHVPLNVVPALKTGSLSQPSDDLLREWNDILLKHSESEKTPLKQEIDFYPLSFAENNSDGRERTSDDERIGGSEFDGINNNGVRETDALHPNDHQERKDWFPRWQARFNPTGKKWGEVTAKDIEVVKSDFAFSTEVARYRVMFTGTRTNEISEGPPNTLTKQLSRTRAEFEDLTSPEQYAALCEVFGDTIDVLSLTHAQGGFDLVVAVSLNKRTEWKHLGKSTHSNVKLRRALLKHRKATEKARRKALRREARANGWTDEMLAVETQHVKERIATAYRAPLEALGQGEGTAVTCSYLGEGETP